MLGSTDCAPKVNALIPLITSGIGNAPTKPSFLVLDFIPAAIPDKYLASYSLPK
ncbi:hypothetical protein D3C80_1943300 [compost metagenome]